MKIYLGKPKDTWFGPYHLADLLKYVGVSEDKCDKIGEKLEHTWVNTLLNWIYEHNPFRKPTEIIHIDNWDVWSMDYTLSPIILKMLVKFKQQLHSAPNVGDSDVPEHIKSMNAPRLTNPYDQDEFYFKRWDWVIDELIWTFEHISEEEWQKQFLDIDNPDYIGYELIQDRIDNGLRLFGKYFRSLWA